MTGEIIADELDGNYFHFLVPEVNGLEAHDDEWQGKLVAMDRIIKSEARKIERSLKEQHALTDKKMDELTAQCSKLDMETTENRLHEELCHVKERMDRLETAMDRVLQKLDAIAASSS